MIYNLAKGYFLAKGENMRNEISRVSNHIKKMCNEREYGKISWSVSDKEMLLFPNMHLGISDYPHKDIDS